MKPPDLSVLDAAGVREWKGPVESLKTAAAQAKLGYAVIDLSKARDKATLFGEIDRQLKLPDHFGHNWDALADVLEDRDWLGTHGRTVVLAHAAAWRKDHPTEWETLEEILGEAAEFWKERQVPFWVFVA
jgi:RNAse (barnase) inhibitor barstar